jgi:hypothetical protein
MRNFLSALIYIDHIAFCGIVSVPPLPLYLVGGRYAPEAAMGTEVDAVRSTGIPWKCCGFSSASDLMRVLSNAFHVLSTAR